MDFLQKSSRGIYEVNGSAKLAFDGIIFIRGEITDEAADEFLEQMLLLNGENRERPIRVLINSPGGSVRAALMMYDAIKGSPAPVQTCCVGNAYSMAAVLLAAGTGGRYMLPHSEAMIHEPGLGSGISGNTSSIRLISESLMEIKNRLGRILAADTGRSEQEIEEALAFDHFFSPQESVKFGLCDKVITFKDILEG